MNHQASSEGRRLLRLALFGHDVGAGLFSGEALREAALTDDDFQKLVAAIDALSLPQLSMAEQFQTTGAERFPATVVGAEA